MESETTVSYAHKFEYRNIPGHEGLYPALLLSISATESVDTVGVIDTGSVRTLFNGELAAAIGLRLEDGTPQALYPINGGVLRTKLLKAHILFNGLEFDLDICFSEARVNRNLLGRDFLEKIQVGFREHHRLIYLQQEI